MARSGAIRWLGLAWILVGSARAGAQAPSPDNANGWLRVGDAYADEVAEGSLERALAAYAHVLSHPEHPDYVAALHRSAWACFLLDRTREAIARFAALVDRLDASGDEAGLRAEALDLLGAMFADPDWDRDGSIDPDGALTRLADPTLVDPARPWLPDLYFETGHALYLTSRDASAIVVLDHALTRWPRPVEGTALEAACARHRARQLARVDAAEAPAPEVDPLCARHAPPRE